MTLPAALLLLLAADPPARAEDAQDPAPDVARIEPAKAAPAPADALYRIGAGDTLQIQVYGEPELSGSFPVNDAGYLEFPLIGAVQVQGLTAAQVAGLLQERLGAGFLLGPNVTAQLGAYGSQPVQVLGAVAKPGLYYLRGQTTVLELLSEAGGVSRGGVNEIRVTHGQESEDVTVLSYDALLSQGSGNITLRGGDIVFVPESLISVMGEVGKPGDVAFREDLTISSCIAAAGGALPTANLGRVYILRGDERIRVNMRKILSGKAEDVPVRAGDRIFVQESAF